MTLRALGGLGDGCSVEGVAANPVDAVAVDAGPRPVERAHPPALGVQRSNRFAANAARGAQHQRCLNHDSLAPSVWTSRHDRRQLYTEIAKMN